MHLSSGPTLAAAAAMLSLVAGCGSANGPDEGSDNGAAQLEHVHGLGVDPGDGALYAGSHHGLFRAEDGEAISGPVADRVQDFMGFTVVGPDHYLASGHPGPGQDGPQALGLIESTDGGETWRTRALAGEADFHALEHRHGNAYGMNAMTGEFLVASDLEEWETRTTLPMADFAVSPEDPDTIVATTEQGPAVSTDGGRSFAPIDDAPLLLLLSWAEDGTLVGVDPDGVVYLRAAGEEMFTRAGELSGRPEALHAEDAETVYAAADGALWRSVDGGRSFAPFPAD